MLLVSKFCIESSDFSPGVCNKLDKSHIRRKKEMGAILRDWPPADPTGSPLIVIYDLHFWLAGPKIFLKASLKPLYKNFERGSARQKHNFWSKVSKNA